MYRVSVAIKIRRANYDSVCWLLSLFSRIWAL
nr:MAG TPA: hypothetical protein [Bacteriophage sp.]